MASEIPEDAPAFEAMMREIDATLTKQGVGIAARPMMAAREISLKFGVQFPVFPPSPRSPPEIRRYAHLSNKVHDWFQATYADRLNIDLSPGRMVIEIDGDLYVLRYPRFWGHGEFVNSRRFLPNGKLELSRPFRLNVVELIDGITEVKAGHISDAALQSIFDWFPIGLRVFYDLETNSEIELLRIAKSDIDTAVDKLMDRGSRYSDSKWSSLQAVEKCLKAAISQEGKSTNGSMGSKGWPSNLPIAALMRVQPSYWTLSKPVAESDMVTSHARATKHSRHIMHPSGTFHNLIVAVAKFRSELTIRKLGIGTYEVVKVVAPRNPKGPSNAK